MYGKTLCILSTSNPIRLKYEKLIVQISFQFLFFLSRSDLMEKTFYFFSLLAIIRVQFSFNLYCWHSTKMGIRNAMQFINNVWVMLVALLLLLLLLMWLIDFQPAKRVFAERRYFNLNFMFDLSFHIDPCAVACWGWRTISLPFVRWMNEYAHIQRINLVIYANVVHTIHKDPNTRLTLSIYAPIT